MIYLIGQHTPNCIEGALLRGHIDTILRLAGWATDSGTDVSFYTFLTDRRWRVLAEFSIKPATYIMNTIRYRMARDGRLDQIVGGPFRFIDTMGRKGYRCSIARRNNKGRIVEIHPSISEFAERTRCRRAFVTKRVFNGERFTVKLPQFQPHTYATGHKYHPLRTR